LTIVAGIRPQTAAFSKVSIEPHLGALHHVAAAMSTPAGTLEVNYNSNTSGVSADIDLPSNVTGELLWKGKTLKLHPGKQQLQLP
jgi:alpha-L-rhamnosidase